MNNLVRPYIGYKFNYEGRDLEVTQIESMFVMLRDHTNGKNLKLSFDSDKYPKIFLPLNDETYQSLPDMSEFLESHSGNKSLEKDAQKSSKKEKSEVELKCRELWDRLLNSEDYYSIKMIDKIIKQNKYERVIDLSINSQKKSADGLATSLLVWAELNREKICANPEMLFNSLIAADLEDVEGRVEFNSDSFFSNLTGVLLSIFESPSDLHLYENLRSFVRSNCLGSDLCLLIVVLFSDGLMPNFKLELRGIKSETLGFLIDRFNKTLEEK